MPQLVGKMNFYVKFGGYEPATGFHFEDATAFGQTEAEFIADFIAPLICDQASITRWETRAADGTFVASGVLGIAGTNGGIFQDFRDETHVVWTSPGTLRPSGNYLPGRTNQHWMFGTPQAGLISSINSLLGGLQTLGFTDSEGATVTGVRSYRPGRRRNLRLTA